MLFEENREKRMRFVDKLRIKNPAKMIILLLRLNGMLIIVFES